MQNDLSVRGFVGFLAVIGLGHSGEARAWGSYGHQQVNRAAVELITEIQPETPLARCLQSNAKMIQRLGVTPDYDWKKLGKEIDANYVKVSLDAVKKPDGSKNTDFLHSDPRSLPDSYEHPLHYFEADAFVPADQISGLPAGPYASVIERYIGLRFSPDRESWVKAVDPEKTRVAPSTERDPVTHQARPPEKVDYVRAHGTAPWRIQQLYALGVADLRAGNTERALIYLGAMGHYIGDMAQPFHTALNFDGLYDPKGRQPVRSAGIHAAFESDMLKTLASPPDHDTFLYGSFEATDGRVIAAAKNELGERGLSVIAPSEIISSVLEVVSRSPAYVQPLLDALWSESVAHPKRGVTRKPAPPSAARVPSSIGMTVLEVAEARMGDAAALLARLWVSAVTEAGLSKSLSCAVFYDGTVSAHPAFRRKVVESYPIPDYLPIGHRAAPHGYARSKTDSPPDGETAGSAPAHPSASSAKPSAAAVRAFRADSI